jgi:hypothetical protein
VRTGKSFTGSAFGISLSSASCSSNPLAGTRLLRVCVCVCVVCVFVGVQSASSKT